MNYKLNGAAYVVRLDPGDEICASLKKICAQEKIEAGVVSGIGTTNRAVIGVYRLAEKSFVPNRLNGEFEIVTLTGNVSRQKGKPYLHLHTSLSNSEGRVYAGHLTEAYISATAEIFILPLPEPIERKQDKATGLNILNI